MLFCNLKQDQINASNYVNKLFRQGAIVEIKKRTTKRSNKQNAYYHCVLTIIARELGYTLEEVKIIYKRMFKLMYEKNDNLFVKSTADMDSKEMTLHIENIRNHAATLSIYCPSPEEFYQDLVLYTNYVESEEEKVA